MQPLNCCSFVVACRTAHLRLHGRGGAPALLISDIIGRAATTNGFTLCLRTRHSESSRIVASLSLHDQKVVVLGRPLRTGCYPCCPADHWQRCDQDCLGSASACQHGYSVSVVDVPAAFGALPTLRLTLPEIRTLRFASSVELCVPQRRSLPDRGWQEPCILQTPSFDLHVIGRSVAKVGFDVQHAIDFDGLSSTF